MATSIPFINLKKADESETKAPIIDYTKLQPAEVAAARFSLEGKTAIVTGGGGGLGFEAANALLEHGVSKLAILDIDEQNSTSAAAILSERHPGSTAVYRTVSVSDEATIDLTVQSLAEEFSKIDILLCFAGVVKVKPALEHTVADWSRVMDVNVIGSFVCAKATAKAMIERHTRGSIVFIASMSASIVNFPQPQVAYNASKSAVLHMQRSLAAEWGSYGIRVNSISPGYMDTTLNEGTHLDEAREMWIARTPLGRIGRRDELNGAIILLCSPAGSFICGSDIKIDGGYTLLA